MAASFVFSFDDNISIIWSMVISLSPVHMDVTNSFVTSKFIKRNCEWINSQDDSAANDMVGFRNLLLVVGLELVMAELVAVSSRVGIKGSFLFLKSLTFEEVPPPPRRSLMLTAGAGLAVAGLVVA